MLTADGKRALLCETARAHGLRVFVETGTYDGETLAAMLDVVDVAYSIEMAGHLFDAASVRFANDARAHILFGDSGKLLPDVLARFDAPSLIWLDAHPGEPGTAGTFGETPLRAELHAIFDEPKFPHVVLIDDARLLGEPGWPFLDEVKTIVRDGWNVDVVDDIVRVTPVARGEQPAPDRELCGHCGDSACWLGNECQGRVCARYEFERTSRRARTCKHDQVARVHGGTWPQSNQGVGVAVDGGELYTFLEWCKACGSVLRRDINWAPVVLLTPEAR